MTETNAVVSSDSIASILSRLADGIRSPVLSAKERRALQARNGRVPVALVQMLIHLAEQSDGTIAGMAFDAADARAMLAETSATQVQLNVARQLLRRLEDDMIQRQASVTDPAFAIFTALGKLVRRKAWSALATAYEQMNAMVPRPVRKPRAKTPS